MILSLSIYLKDDAWPDHLCLQARQSNAEEITNRAMSSIFFPKEGEQKSILLKRGSIQLCNNARKDLMLFSRGCVVSSIDFCTIAEDALYRDEGCEDGALIIDWGQNSWRKRFDLIDFDKSGCKSILIFLSPKGEHVP
jgi:hypothetical protein